MATACALVIVPLATSDPSGPWSGALVPDTTEAVLAADAGAPAAARAVVPPPPARKLAAARPARSFLFMMSPLRLALFRSNLTKSLQRAPAWKLSASGGDGAGRGTCATASFSSVARV